MRQIKQIVESPGAPNENEIWLDDDLKLKSFEAGTWEDLVPSSGIEHGYGTDSVQQMNGNLTVFGNNAFAEGTSTTIATERGITSSSTNDAIVTEWLASDPESDKFTVAKGVGSHVEGNNCLALGDHSHAEGNGTLAYDNSSHSEGTGSQAIGSYSHAEGLDTIANNVGEYAGGYNNVSHNASNTFGDAGNTIHSVGIGGASLSKNAFEIMQNGDAYLYGVGGYDGTNANGSEVQTLQQSLTGSGSSALIVSGLYFNEGGVFSITDGTSYATIVSAFMSGKIVLMEDNGGDADGEVQLVVYFDGTSLHTMNWLIANEDE